MVDFRYHLVSLVSVFLALAVGIILGAGPLQNSIGTALSGQVSDLSEQNAELKNNNGELKTQLEKEQSAFEELAPGLVKESLSGRQIAIVSLPGADDAVVESLTNTLDLSGATVTGRVRVTQAWTSAADVAFRNSFSEQIQSYLAQAPEATDANTVLTSALNQVVRLGTEDPDNSTLAGLITGSDTPMVEIEGLTTAADAIVVVAPDDVEPEPQDGEVSPDAEAVAQAEYDLEAYTAMVSLLGENGPTVAYGAADTAGDVVRVVRDSVETVSTVDSPASKISPINVVGALAAELEGGKIVLGYDDGATAVTALPEKSPATIDDQNDEGNTPGEPASEGDGDTGDTAHEEESEPGASTDPTDE